MAAGAIGPTIGQNGNHRRSPVRRLERLSLALTMSAVVLTACAWDPPTIARTPREVASTESNAKSRLAARKGSAQNGTAPGGTAGEPLEAPGTEMAALEVDLTNFKERLIGLDSDEINDLMGTPGLERAEPPALIWQYRHQVCTVDVFMFDDGGGATVDHVEVRPASGGSVSERECFTSLLRNVPPPSASAVRAPSPSTPVGRRPAPSAAPPSGPAQTPSSSRPPVPSTAAPSAAPVMPVAPSATPPDGDDGPPPADTDVDFDFGAALATPGSAPGGAQGRLPSAAPSSEAIPTLPPDIPASAPPVASPLQPPGPSGSLGGLQVPMAADVTDDGDFSDPLTTVAPPQPSAQAAKPTPAPSSKPTATPAPAPAKAPASALAEAPIVAPVPPPSQTAKPAPSVTTAKPAPTPALAPNPTPNPAPAPAPLAAIPQAMPAAVPPAPPIAPPVAPSAAPVPPPAAPAATPAPLTPRVPAVAAAAQPKGAAKGAAARQIEDIEDDLPPDFLTGRRDDDPAHNNDDLVE